MSERLFDDRPAVQQTMIFGFVHINHFRRKRTGVIGLWAGLNRLEERILKLVVNALARPF